MFFFFFSEGSLHFGSTKEIPVSSESGPSLWASRVKGVLQASFDRG